MKALAGLRGLLQQSRLTMAPGVYDAFGALLADKAGFKATYLSGASIAYSRFGSPDIGLIGMTEVGDTLSAITDRCDIPVIVDADTGFGNALNVMRTVRLFERSGAAAIQLEDQTLPKRCGHLAGKTLVSREEMIGKIKAATDARRNAETMIIARTDAIAVEGITAALDRAEKYAEAGADILFVEAPRDVNEMNAIVARLGALAPLVANMVEGGQSPDLSARQLEGIGYRLAIFPGGMMRAIANTIQEYLQSLQANGSTAAYRDQMLDFGELNDLLRTDEILKLGKRFDADRFGGNDA